MFYLKKTVIYSSSFLFSSNDPITIICGLNAFSRTLVSIFGIITILFLWIYLIFMVFHMSTLMLTLFLISVTYADLLCRLFMYFRWLGKFITWIISFLHLYVYPHSFLQQHVFVYQDVSFLSKIWYFLDEIGSIWKHYNFFESFINIIHSLG